MSSWAAPGILDGIWGQASNGWQLARLLNSDYFSKFRKKNTSRRRKFGPVNVTDVFPKSHHPGKPVFSSFEKSPCFPFIDVTNLIKFQGRNSRIPVGFSNIKFLFRVWGGGGIGDTRWPDRTRQFFSSNFSPTKKKRSTFTVPVMQFLIIRRRTALIES